MGTKNPQDRARAHRQGADERRQEEQRRGRRRRLLWAGGTGAAALVLVAAVGWFVATGDEPEHEAGVEEFTHVHGLSIPAWAPEEPFLATHEGLVAIDPGAEWRVVSEELHDFMGFTAHPTDEGVLFSSGHPAPGSGLSNPVGFMASEDGGATWEVRSLEGEVDFHAMAVGARGEAVYGWFDTLYRSTDEGYTWEQVEAPALADAQGAAALAVHPEDADEVWAGTQAGLLRSTDGGGTWEPVLERGPVSAVHVDPTDPERMLAYTAGDGLMESTDGGGAWTGLGWNLGEDMVGHLAIHPEDPDTVYAGTYGEGVYRSQDGGRTWEALARAGVTERR
ncbi:F510_1955 family glycosylhydrolase [Nocardiopsis aegyptia]|uniref:F510_1955 family glycosylhydrolase n=1 Tax=Nocardiopsis aegyptia TaxID=220378 RepID=UPI00366BF8D3